MVAVDGADLSIGAGEFFSMLGPSGSGKTTVLRMIAGFEQPTAGTIELAGEDVTGRPPYDRDVNTVFQDYALFPHMSVAQNVEYGLRSRRSARPSGAASQEALEQVRLADLGDRAARPSSPAASASGSRWPARWSTGPSVLLLDEPLGALDLKLREQMQVELKEIQREVGITFVFVTHDQDEALTLSDRIAVFNDGRIEQVGTAREIYEQPVNAVRRGLRRHLQPARRRARPSARPVVAGTFGIRPEKLTVGTRRCHRRRDRRRSRHRAEVVYAGPVTRFVVDLEGGGRLIALEENGSERPPRPAQPRVTP